MRDTLQDILTHKAKELAAARLRCPEALLRELASEQSPARDFVAALSPRPSCPIPLIAECKQRSPSRGVLAPDYDPQAIACAYESGGAAAISVLTDTLFFGGSLADLRKVKELTKLPVLRKDFIIDPYQIVEARAYGADSFLLLAGVLDLAQLQYFIEIGREYGMEPLVESHHGGELAIALQSDAQVLGINSRNLKTFAVDLDTAKNLLRQHEALSSERLFVCESGIKSRQDIAMMQQVGYKAFLVGETLMRQPDHAAAVRSLLS